MKYTASCILAIYASLSFANAAGIKAKAEANAEPAFEWKEGKFPVDTDKQEDYRVTHPLLPEELIKEFADAQWEQLSENG